MPREELLFKVSTFLSEFRASKSRKVEDKIFEETLQKDVLKTVKRDKEKET